MSDKLSAAIEELEAQLAEQLEEVAGTKKLINSLLKRTGQGPRYQDVSVEHRGAMRADEYYGKPLATAVQMYLERRHQAVTAEEIYTASIRADSISNLYSGATMLGSAIS